MGGQFINWGGRLSIGGHFINWGGSGVGRDGAPETVGMGDESGGELSEGLRQC